MKRKHSEQYAKIALAIKEARLEKGYSQEELARRLCLSKSYISKIEAPNCEKSFSLEVLFDMAEVLEVPVVRFFNYLE